MAYLDSMARNTKWAVAWTKARCEKSLVEFLENKRVTNFLPLLRTRRSYGSRVRSSLIPLFPGYVFFDSECLSKAEVFDSRKVADILMPSDFSELDSELRQLSTALQVDNSLRETRFGQVGRKVSVSRGPMKGLIGQLVRMGSISRLVVSISFLGKAAELEIDEAFVEPVLE